MQRDSVREQALVVKERFKLCPSCGNFTEFSDKHMYCTICGDKLIIECQKCTEPILYPALKDCSVCGTILRVPNLSGGFTSRSE